MYGQLIEAGNGRFSPHVVGGDEDLAAGGKRPQTNVNIVALQSQVVTLDAQGEAEITLVSPTLIGRLRLTAQAWTDNQFGMAQQPIEGGGTFSG